MPTLRTASMHEPGGAHARLRGRRFWRRGRFGRWRWAVVLGLWMSGAGGPACAGFALTEFMAANVGTLADEDGASSDWIEVHNPAAAEASLDGWYLTDDPGDRTKWAFPATHIAAGGYLVVFASNHDRRVVGAALHTNFRLNAEGGYLALVAPGGETVTEYGAGGAAYPPQADDIAYGLTTNTPPAVKYFTTPTPGAPNVGGVANVTLVPGFSVASGVFTNSVTVTLTSPLPGADIRYTTDGTRPGVVSALYTAPLTFSTSTRLRAALCFAGEPPGPSATACYVRLAASAQTFASPLPIVVLYNFGAGPVPGVDGYGPYRDGSYVVQAPMQTHAFTLFDRAHGWAAFTNPPAAASRAGVRLHGTSSFSFVRKSYKLETWTETDEEGRDVPLLGMPADNDWVLYAPSPSNFDASLLHNAFIYELASQSGYPAPRWRFVEVFLNTNGTDLAASHNLGLYLLVEKIKRARDRVAFEPFATNGTRGGWMINSDRMDALPAGTPVNSGLLPRHFHTAGPDRILQTEDDNARGYQGPAGGSGLPPPRDDMPNYYHSFFNFESPRGWDITPDQRAHIQAFVRAFDAALYGPNFAHPDHGYAPFIDVGNFVHHFILQSFPKNQDAEVLSTYFVRETPTSKMRHGPLWDFDRAYTRNPTSGDPLAHLKWASDRLFYPRLFADPNFNQAYIDKWQELRRGAFATSNLLAILDAQTNAITPAVAARSGLTAAAWAANVGAMRNWLVTRAAAIDAQFPAPPVFSQDGGAVPNGFQLAILGTPGTLYFTTDGSDPRAPGGNVADSAQAYALPITLHAPTTVFARIRSGASWSGFTRATFFTPQDLGALRLTEIMYHPPPTLVGATLVDGDAFEFLEFKNTGATPLDLSGLTFASGLTFTFPVGTRLDPGAFFVLARDPAMLQAMHPGLAVHGVFTAGKLDNAGESLKLAYPGGATLISLTYDDLAPWPVPADGYGFSLVPCDLGAPGDPGLVSHWRASAQPGGSPGADDPPGGIPPVRVNEVLSASTPPAVDAIELVNPTAESADVGGWFLTDDSAVPRKFRIPPGTVMAPAACLVIDETAFHPAAGASGGFALGADGDEVYLFSGDARTNLTGYSHGFRFGGAEAGVTLGRHVISTGEERFTAQAAPTLGAANAGPLVGPVVISEIHYHPEPDDFEFVELHNVTAAAVDLFDAAVPTNTWRVSGLGFVFPPHITLAPEGRLLLIGTNEAAFRARHLVAPGVLVVGPWEGQLQNSGERLEVRRLYTHATNTYEVAVDAVRYNDKAPWPPAADGGGFSLQRRAPGAFGDDPAHWVAAPPTPGADLPVGTAPVLLEHPQSRIVVFGQSATFSVSAAGSEPLYYQWRLNGEPIPGAGEARLVVASAQSSDAGVYSVVVYNNVGSAVSSNATLTFAWPPTILTQPRSVAVRGSTNTATYGQTGSNVTFEVVATGLAPVTYQWRFRGAALPGATSPSLTLSNVTLAHDGPYDVVVTDAVGATASAPATLTLLLSPAFTNSPVSQDVVVGGSVTWSAAVCGHPLPFGFEWKRIVGGVTLASNTLAQHADFFTLPHVQPSHSGYYRVIARNLAAPSGIACTFMLTVLADTDADGLPDSWEAAHGLATNNPADATLDGDADGADNRAEYAAGTDPNDPASRLHLRVAAPAGPTLEFLAVSNRTYSILEAADAAGGAWQRCADVLAHPTNRVARIPLAPESSPRFFRLTTPRPP
ncbi:MAG: lamin tail domain-containing protein [Verrucomicrobia bacterium]|nr:lamin tail domain-containing protein [Verrucomicrobiota bacterium]